MDKNPVKNEHFDLIVESDLHYYILELLETGTLNSLAELIDLMIYANQKNVNVDVLKGAILEFISDNDYLNLPPFSHIQGSNTLSLFVARYIGMILFSSAVKGRNDREDTETAYHVLLNDIKNYKETDEKPLSHETIKELISVYENFDKKRKIAYNQYDKPLTIFTVDFESDLGNSVYHPTSNIILLNTIPPEKQAKVGSAEYIFIHELGHVLQCKITENDFKTPQSFKDTVVKYIFPEAPDKILPEIFADCFSIALMNGAKFEDKNPFIEPFGEVGVEMIETYFKRLIEEI